MRCEFYLSWDRVQRLLGECALLERKNIRQSVEQKLQLLSKTYKSMNNYVNYAKFNNVTKMLMIVLLILGISKYHFLKEKFQRAV